MKLKFTKEEMILLNAICDIEVSADGTKTYSMKPTIITDEGYTDIETVSAFELASENKFLSDPLIDFKFKEPATKIIDEKEAQSINETLFDKLIKGGISLKQELHLDGIIYDVCGIDYVNKKIIVRKDGIQYDYFELLKSNQ